MLVGLVSGEAATVLAEGTAVAVPTADGSGSDVALEGSDVG
jgi:hypothetical protein